MGRVEIESLKIIDEQSQKLGRYLTTEEILNIMNSVRENVKASIE